MNGVRIILGGQKSHDTNPTRKAYGKVLVANQEMFHIIQNHYKGEEPIMVWEDFAFIEKEVARLVHPYYDFLVITLQITNNNIY